MKEWFGKVKEWFGAAVVWGWATCLTYKWHLAAFGVGLLLGAFVF